MVKLISRMIVGVVHVDNLTLEIEKRVQAKYKSLAEFSRVLNVPYTTVLNVLKNKVENSRYAIVSRMCKLLSIEVFDGADVLEDEESIKFLSQYGKLDEKGQMTIKMLIEREFDRCAVSGETEN